MDDDPHPIGHRLPVDPDLDPADAAEPAVHPQANQRATRRRRAEPSVLAAIALGGCLGAPARYGVAQVIGVAQDGFPWATFWTNISGSFCLGLILALILERFPPTRYLRPFVATGFLGAYTTYSTFAVETDLLIKNGHVPIALTYATASLVSGFLAVWVGIWAARTIRLPHRGGKQ
ncbi:MAG: fluoride exporter [Acidimicrobiaceae bacterium]|nr:fluoride exporter [Acidimicrobiaceae bacterium]